MSLIRFEVYQCETCGNQVIKSIDGGGELVCCGKPMKKLEVNSTDGAAEKHVPVYEYLGSREMLVRVGSLDHPMTEEHYIGWIAVVYQNSVIWGKLKPGMAPQIIANVESGYNGEIYAWCNLHGLWMAHF